MAAERDADPSNNLVNTKSVAMLLCVYNVL